MNVKCTAVVLAAGRSLRMGGQVRKQYIQLGGAPLFAYAWKALEDSPVISDMILVVPDGDQEAAGSLLLQSGLGTKLRKIVAGGSERYFSVMNGLQAIDWPCDYVFIHDGARPFVDEPTIERLFDCVQKEMACVAGMPSKDTVKIADTEGFVQTTPDRSRTWIIQTPQVFAFGLIRHAYKQMMDVIDTLKGKGVQITDDSMVVESMLNCKVRLVEASYRNIKITTPEDLIIAEAFLQHPEG